MAETLCLKQLYQYTYVDVLHQKTFSELRGNQNIQLIVINAFEATILLVLGLLRSDLGMDLLSWRELLPV
jgi:hypothetical protein